MKTRHLVQMIALTAVFAVPALAQDPKAALIPDRFRFRVGTLFATINSDATIDSETTSGREVDFEEVLDLPSDETTLRMDGFWRIAKKHGIEFGYFGLNRDNDDVVLDRDIVIGGVTYQASAEVDSGFDSMFAFVAYRWDFLVREKYRLGATFGVTYTDLSSTIEGVGTVGGVTRQTTREASIGLPVPIVGMAFNHTPNKHVTWDAYGRFFYWQSGGFEGVESDLGARVEWFFTKHFGLGAAYEFTRIGIPEFEDGDLSGDMSYTLSGARLFLGFTF